MFAGLIPSRWQEHHDYTHKDPQHADTNTKTWARKLSWWLTMQGFELWELRNQQLHGNKNRRSMIHDLLNQKIIHLYSLQEEISHHDRHIFSMELEQRLEMTETQKRLWVEATSHTIYK